ncbi:helicase HerA-like domain-containing protein [Microbulbifer pacificus]|uniref:helicase HerA-like domain-containing protein n=1 Tax=Microbulbifer pacificus TaxID=407164 RepID=UPI000CF48D8C|nr:helicase HerA-like domain-containing protein [Microbulbifer pacificus]
MPNQPDLSQPIAIGLEATSAETPATTGRLLPQMLNRHGLICGATGTGKTVTLRYLVEQLSARGVATLVTDLKGDLSGLGAAGGGNDKVRTRLPQFGLDDKYFRGFPLILWGKGGLPMRTTPTELGPELIGRMLQLNDNQLGLMQLLFRIADQQGLLLLDWKDLLALIDYADQNRKALLTEFGTISSASLGAIKRKYLALESQGADALFGEPALDLNDLTGSNSIHLLDASDMQPAVYGILLLWLLAELYENLSEVGDRELRLVLFFDEAHLLFDDLPKNLCDEVEQIVKLIRSRGVGIFFITQNPLDIPEDILAQLGNRVQHALRAYTPSEQRAVRAAANSFRVNPEIDTAQVIGELGVGEALVSCLDENGVPQPVSRLLIHPPASRLTPLDDNERNALMKNDPLRNKYSQKLDRESAYEQLQQRRTQAETEPAQGKPRAAATKPSALEKSFDKMATSFGRQIGRELMRGIMGALTGRKR